MMRHFSNATLVLMLLLGCFVTGTSYAQPNDGPVYSRQRTHARAGGVWNGGSQYLGRYQGYHHGYASYQPAIAGSWYARPYPHHFDYYRQRSSAPPRLGDCPCAKAQAEE